MSTGLLPEVFCRAWAYQSQIDLLRDCVECSFWTFTGQTQAVMASRGSRPGDGLADVLFGALFAVILNCLDHACQLEGICHTSLYEALGEAPRPLQIAWADDLSLLVDFDSPQEAVDLLPRLATLILRTIEAFRFRVNLGPGKTEALVKIGGNGATAARARLLSDADGIPTEDGRHIRLVPEYKYLGVPQRSNDSGRRDIEAAAGRGRAVWSQAANLIHSPSLPWPLKLAWLTGRTLPAAFSSLSTTVAVSARALSPLKGFYDQCLRQLATAWTDGHHVSSETLQVCISAPDVEVSICVARVRLLCRLVQRRSDSAYAALVAAWDRAGRWAVLLQQAVRRLWPNTDLPPLDLGGPTLALVQRSTRPLLHACRRVSRHGSMLQALCHIWTFFGQGQRRVTIGRAIPCSCEDCGAVLPSRHALAAHQHRMHGRVALLTQYTLGPVAFGVSPTFTIQIDFGITYFTRQRASTASVVLSVPSMNTDQALKGPGKRVTRVPLSSVLRGLSMPRLLRGLPPQKVVSVPPGNSMKSSTGLPLARPFRLRPALAM